MKDSWFWLPIPVILILFIIFSGYPAYEKYLENLEQEKAAEKVLITGE